MKTPCTLLAYRTVRELGAVARCYGLLFNNRHPKNVIYAQLVAQLRAGQHLQRAYRTLTSNERDALRILQAVGGVVSCDQFARDFGVIRPYRPWVAGAPRQPWKHDASVAERLWYLAFIEVQGKCVMLCEDTVPLLPPLPRVHPIPNPMSDLPPTPDTLMVDMAMFLGMLTRERVRLLRGRHLTPRVFRTINARLQQAESNVDSARSERQIGQVRWLHYVAACAELVENVCGTLKPSFGGWVWLDAAPDTRWQQITAAIKADLDRPISLWGSFRLPHVSRAEWDALLVALDALPTESVYGVRAFLRALRIRCPGLVAETVRALLAGPLTWLGRVTLSTDGKQFAHLTPSVPTCVVEQPCIWTQHEYGIDIHLSTAPPLRPLAESLAWIGIVGAGLHTLRIDAEAVARALRAESNVLSIADVVRRLTGTPLTQAAFDSINVWAGYVDQLRIEHVDLLVAADPALLNALYSDRRLRTLIDKPLSPRHAVIRVGMRAPLDQRLRRRGYRAQSNPPDVRVTPNESLNQKAELMHDVAAAAWLAMRVYQSLGELVPPTLPIPGAVSDELKAVLSDAQRDQLEQAALYYADAVRQALRGGISMFSPSPIAQDDPAAIRAAIERAYAYQQPLTVVYFSPAYGSPTQRTITPTLPIRWEGDYGYIEAWCQLDNAPRTFRLDRILRIIDQREPPQNGWACSSSTK